MEKKTYTLNTLLAVVLGLTLLVAVLVRTFAPRMILPHLDVPNMVLLSLAALLADHYLAPGAKRCYICIPVFAFLTFALLPMAAGIIAPANALMLGIKGAVVFTVTTWLFTSMADRISTGPQAKLAPIMSAFGLYLASQCFMGMF